MISWDVIVIGGGGAGLTAAFTAAGLGRKTLLVEKDRTGGECTWNGCIPSKALIHLSELAHFSGRPPADDTFAAVDRVRREVYSHETPEKLKERGVSTIIGTARFTGQDTIEVDGNEHRGRKIILAVGSRPLVPPIPGLKDLPCLTNESLFEMTELPPSMLILGGGPIGVEMAQAMQRLGVQVTVVEMMDRILFREDRDTAAVIQRRLESEGVRLVTGARAVAAGRRGDTITLETERTGDGGIEVLEARSILVAVGRGANTDSLNLEAAGVQTTPKGVRVDARLRTTNRRILAAGDVAGPFAFSHTAEYQGGIAAMNAVLGPVTKARYHHVAWTTFTDPEIAGAGLTEEAARARYGNRIRIYTRRFEDSDRGMTAPGDTGLVKIILDRRYRVIGAHIAGPRAGELISEVQVLKTLGIPYHRLRRVIHPYPVYADILRQIAKTAAIDRIRNHPLVRLFRGRSEQPDG